MVLFLPYENLSFIWQTVARLHCAKVLLMDVFFVCHKMTYENLDRCYYYLQRCKILSVPCKFIAWFCPAILQEKTLNAQSHWFFQSPAINSTFI